jgi:TonB family protein
MNLELWLTNLWFYSLQVAALIVIGALLIWILKIQAPRFAHNCWRFLLLGCLALPFVQPWREAPAALVDAAINPLAPSPGGTWPQPAAYPWGTLVLGVLILGTMGRLAWMAFGLAKLREYRRRGRPAADLPGEAADLADRLGVRPRIFISTSPGPVTYGWLAPVVFLPDAFSKMPSSTQRLALCHELVHVKRRDWLSHTLEELVRAFFWFHPAVVWLIGRIRLTREQVVDREVIRFTSARRPYLDSLYQMAATRTLVSQAPAPLFLEEAELTRRVALIVREVRMSKKRAVLSVATIALVLFVGAGWAVSAFPLTREAAGEPDSGKAPVSVKADDAAAALVHKVQPSYPAKAKEAGIQGTVELSIRIDKTGQVSEVKVLKGDPLLADAAAAAVKQWRYKPVEVEGKPVEALATVTVNFVLANEAAPTRPAHPIPAGVTPPKVIDKVTPTYPAEAKEKQIQGEVVVKAKISETGVVTSAEAISGPELLQQAAVDAVKQWRFDPAVKDGKPIAVNSDIEIKFRLK